MPHSINQCGKCEFILDIYFKEDITHIWTKTILGETKHYKIAYHPKIYVAADFTKKEKFDRIDELQYISSPEYPRDLVEIARIVYSHPDVISVKFAHHYKASHYERLSNVLEVEIYSYNKMEQVIEDFKTRRINMYNIDINPRQHFFIDTGCRPMSAVHINTKERKMVRKFDEKRYYNDYELPIDAVELNSISNHDNFTDLLYFIPPLTAFEIKVETKNTGAFMQLKDPIKKITISLRVYKNYKQNILGKHTLDGEESKILLHLIEIIRKYDPDFLLVPRGDKFILNYLAYRAKKNYLASIFVLGRLKKHPLYAREKREGQSYMTYGSIIHRAPIIYIPGRVHIDLENSFFFHDSGFEGLIELSRMSGTPLVRVSRASIGTVLTGVEMFINSITIPSTLLPPIKALGETFKTADHLLISDNGGMIYDAVPGIYTNIWTIDYTSLYPFIMLNHNISSETVLCEHEDCMTPITANPNIYDDDPFYYANKKKIAQRCYQYDNIVPELNYHICTKRIGIVTRTMNHILHKRVNLKYMQKQDSTPEILKQRFKRLDSAMKWILVSCLHGSTRVIVRKNGVIISDRIDNIVNNHIENDNLETIGINISGQPELKKVRNVIKTKPMTATYEIEFRGGEKIIATGDHLWPTITKNGWKDIRTDELMDSDWIPILKELPVVVNLAQNDQKTQNQVLIQKTIYSDANSHMQNAQEEEFVHSELNYEQDQLRKLNKLTTAPISFVNITRITKLEKPSKYVYCFELDSLEPWFMIEGGLITHNCFGYLGYKNARWGRIEAHQSVTAYARRYLLQAKLIANEFGYKLIGGITDSLFLQARKPEFDTLERMQELVTTITNRTKIPMDLEGKFRWVVFANVKEYTKISALNRYFGYFEHGKFKLRGIRHRQRRVTNIERDFQEEILDHFKYATTLDEFKRRIPSSEKILVKWQKKLQNREMNPRDLIIKLKTGKGSDGYKARNTHQALVAQSYKNKGRYLEAGENMYYIVRNDSANGYARVTIGPEVDKQSEYDAIWYCKMLENAYLEITETPQRQFFNKIIYDGKPKKSKLEEYIEEDTYIWKKDFQKRAYKLIQKRKKCEKMKRVGLDNFF